MSLQNTSVRLALEVLHDAIEEQFKPVLPEVQFAFGWKQQYRTLDGTCRARVVTRPGNVMGDMGADAPPRRQGQNPRHVANLDERATVYLRAYDATVTGGDAYDRAQYRIGRLLFEAWRSAAQAAACGTFQIGESKWLMGSVEAGKGVEIIVPVILQAPIPDYFDTESTNAAPLKAALEASIGAPSSEAE